MATHIKNIINKFLSEKKSETKSTARMEKITEENLGAQLKNHIRLHGLYKKNLIFYSDSSSASYEFKLRKEPLLKALKKEFPEVEGLKVKIA